MNEDIRHLKLLSIFHYVLGVITFGFCLFPGIYVVVGGLTSFQRLKASPDPPPPFLGWFIFAIGLGLLLSYVVITVCLVLAGRYLARHRHPTFCLVVAALECMLMPFGTVLGVLTIIVLNRPSLRNLFSQPLAIADPS